VNKSQSNVSFRDYARFLRRYLRKRIPLVVILGVTLLIRITLQVINPQIMRSFIDLARAGSPQSTLTNLALIFIAIAVGQQLVGALVAYITEIVGWSATNEVRLDLARYTLGLDMSFHTAHTPGEMIERIDGDVMALSNFFSQFIMDVFGNSLLVAGVLLVLLREEWRIGLALATFVAITVVVLLRLANISTSSWEEERKASANLYGFLEERMAGTEDIRSNNAKDYVLDRFYRLTRTLMRRTMTAAIKVNILMNTTWTLFAFGNAVSILVTASLFYMHAITLGTVFMVIYYTNMLNWPLERITQQLQDLQRASASLIRIMSIQRIQGKIPGEDQFARPEQPVLAPGALAVTFDSVSFAYHDQESSPGDPSALAEHMPASESTAHAPGAPASAGVEYQRTLQQEAELLKEQEMVLCDISFQLAPGRVLGLLGRTGSGKTTLTRLLFRLYDTDEGAIRLGSQGRSETGDPGSGEINIKDIPVQELRRSIGMVTQNIQLFHATVRENLTFFDASIPDERILQAIHDLGLSRWFDALPNGLDTELESGGGGLSAGEAQLLAFTRIFLHDPGLVILDEATSRLDPATEYMIEQAVDRLVRGRTAIIVAHRLGTVQRADNILVLENGEILEYGERARLAEDPSTRFYRLLETGLEEVLA
jgi:ATP-binding cassette, subfamily B, bacterial